MRTRTPVIYFLLLLCGISMVIPFVWMVTTAVKSPLEVNKGHVGFIPAEEYPVYSDDSGEYRVKIIKTEGDSSYVNVLNKDGQIIRSFFKIPSREIGKERKIKFHMENFLIAFQKVPFGRYFLNTIFVSATVVLGVIITGSLAAYAFARMRFRGRELIFYLFISMMMVPQPVYLIPSYIVLDNLGWLDTYQALIVPWIANIFTIFLLRQQFKTIPQELFDAAAIDGCSRWGILWKIVLPLSRSVISTAAIFGFIGSWNSFMWPLVMIDNPKLRVLQVGLSYFSQEASSQTTLLMAASTFSILPLLVLFLIAQKQIIASFASSGLKG
ncbi:MAG: carbohydrate ABC transporter permease [Candidatus Cloacimonetes bacterium]|nr:carbohydrate ABC transporter permease [Candidatus Cloacimonadota bacterium]